MAKSITFSVKLNVDGKDQLVAATADVKNLREAVRSMDSPMQGLLKQFNNWGFAFQNISSAANGIASSLNSLTAESRAFGGAMAAANTMAGKSGEDFAKLKTQVAELSKTIPIARDQLANGLYQVISNGVPEDNWMEYLEKSAKASVGGIANLEEVVKVTSTVIKNYGLAWGDAGTIQDKIQLTAKNGVTSFEQMAQALPRVTANAATLGVSVDELMASFATLTGVSGNTAEVSTQLAAIFTALVKPSSEATKMAQQMGIQFDAAAIKAAGGMKNFLTQLNADVKRYAAASGMLEQEVYGKLFGSAESLRALTPLTGNLADKFEENVDAMAGSAGTIDGAFKTMGSTGSAQLQKLNNALGEYTDALQKSVGNFMPYVNFTTQMISATASVGTLVTSLKGLGVATGVVTVATRGAHAATALWTAVIPRMNALVQTASASFRGATVSAGTLKLAIQGLMISTGVTAVVYILSTAIGSLMAKSDGASASLEELTQAQMEAKQAQQQMSQQVASATTQLTTNINKLKEFKGSKEEEKKLVEEMNSTYGTAFGYYSTVSQWYKALVADSKAYCKQIELEAQVEARKNKIKELVQKQYNLTHDDKGNKKTYRKTTYTGGVAEDYIEDGRKKTRITKLQEHTSTWTGEQTRGYRDAQKGIDNLTGELSALQKESDKIANSIHKGANVNPTSPTAPKASPTSSNTPKATPTSTTTKERPALRGSMDWYEEEIQKKRKERDASNDDTKTASLNSEMEGLQRSLYMLKVKVGIETPPGADIQKELRPMTETVLESFDDLQQRIKDNPIHVETDPEGLEKMRKKMSDLENIQMLGNTNLQSFESVKASLKSITDITNPTEKGLAAAGEACSVLGGAMQQLGADSEAAKAGMVIAAVGQIVLSFAQALASCKTWVEWLAFGISGTAQMISLISTVSGFATGGIVGGSSTTGDKIPIRVNSGEMVLNKTQQARLFAIANGKERPKVTLPDYRMPKMTLNTAALSEMNRQSTQTQSVRFKIDGRNLVGVLANETRVTSRSGRRTNIQI